MFDPKDMHLPHFLRSRLTIVATLAALKAGDILRKGFGSAMSFETKEGRHNLVTEWDYKSETAIIETIKDHFPDHDFLAEESGASKENPDGIQWVIDPLDGTTNFFHHIPMFCVSIAASFHGEILAGAVYHPLLHELFIAEKEKGAYLNGKPLKVSETNILDHSIAATGFPYNVSENPLKCLDHFVHLAKMGVPIRRIGSAALDLCYVAAGRFDLFWEPSLKPWDYAAGKLLIEEAGGSFTNFEGKPYTSIVEGSIIASNGKLQDQMVKNIQITIDDAVD